MLLNRPLAILTLTALTVTALLVVGLATFLSV